jgi:putative selenium metabolism hydrolase
MEPSRLISFTQSILRERSLPRQEASVVEKIKAEMQSLHFDRVWVDENGSVIGVVEGHLPGPTLLMDAHCDVVDAVPADWKHDPFGAEIEDGYLYGRGTTDMKGALAAMVYAAASMDREKMSGRVMVSASVMEEVFEGGALKTIMDDVQPDFILIGESTEFNLNRGGRGRAEIFLETSGRSAHSSSPEAGRCAVHDMMALIQVIESLPLPSHPLIGPGLMVLTDIHSEPYPAHSVIPNRCQVTYDRRLVPGETPESVLDSLHALTGLDGVEYAANLVKSTEKTATGNTLHGIKFFPGWLFDEKHPFIQASLRGLRAAGFEARLGAYQFCTNAAYSAGIAHVPTIGFGPCREQDAHTVDERIALEDLSRAVLGYQKCIEAVLYR